MKFLVFVVCGVYVHPGAVLGWSEHLWIPGYSEKGGGGGGWYVVWVCVCVCRAIATGTVGPVSTGPLFEATTTFLPIFMNLAVRPADRLAAKRPQLTELEIDSLKAMLPSLQSTKVSQEPILITEK